MDEKRYWLVRDKAGLEGYYRFRDDEPPRGSAGLWHAAGSGGALVRGPLVLAPDGTVYGHKLEPGGGPVDVSEWFPEGGRVCTNCGWVQDKACIEPSDPIRAITCTKWKPREQTQGPEMIPVSKADRAMRDTLRWFEDMIYNPQGNPAREEGGREMKKFSIDVVEEPTVVGAQGGEGPVDVVKDFRVTASSERGAIFLAGQSVPKEKKFAEERLAFAVTSAPFEK